MSCTIHACVCLYVPSCLLQVQPPIKSFPTTARVYPTQVSDCYAFVARSVRARLVRSSHVYSVTGVYDKGKKNWCSIPTIQSFSINMLCICACENLLF